MADTTTTTPPINPVSTAFAAAADAAVASARSPLEAALEQVTTPNRPAVQHDNTPQLDANALEQARAADIAKSRGEQPAAAKPPATDSTPDPSVSSEPWKQHSKKPKERRTADDWNTVKAKHDQEMAALRKELEAARTSTASDVTKHPDFARLKQQHDEYLDALKQVAVERDPEFKARYEPRREAVLGKIRQVAGAARDTLESILQLPAGKFRDSAIEQALADFQPSTRATIMGQLQVLSAVDAEREADLASRKALYESNQQQFATQQQAAARDREARLNAALDKQIAAWSDPDEGMLFLQRRDGDDKWNAQVDKRIALARSIFTGEGDVTTLSQAALKAANFDAALLYAYEATAEVEKLTAQLNKLRGLQPGDGSLAASIMQSGRNDATVADPFDPAYVNHFNNSLEEARRADFAKGGG